MSVPNLTDPELEELRSLVAAVDRPRRGRPPGFVGNANIDYNYECSECHQQVGREHIVFREISFRRLDTLKTIRTRRSGWVCDNCIKKDPVFNSPKQKPGRRHA
jgi:predicted SprT family Zn-dependent metalloprotease